MSETNRSTKEVIEQFWETMKTNDFRAVGELLHDDYVLEWPQSGERVRGRENFVAINERYPAHGRWKFNVHRILAEGDQAVSDVDVTDGVVRARVITFSTIQEGKILHQTEFWPDPFGPAAWRAQWVEEI
jgi:ketosteroid isomerase-like protein